MSLPVDATDANAACTVTYINVPSRDNSAQRSLSQEPPAVRAILDGNHGSGNANAAKKTVPTVQATQRLSQNTAQQPQRPHPISSFMNSTIDQGFPMYRDLLIADGTVPFEDDSSIGIDLDQVDAFYLYMERRDFSRRLLLNFVRIGIHLMGMALSWVVAIPFYLPCVALGFHDLRFTPAFSLAVVPFIILLICGMQPLGAMLLYWTHRLRRRMLPRRNASGTLSRVLLSGACCFEDNVLSAEQIFRLSAVEMVHAAGVYLCGAASFMTASGLRSNNLHDGNTESLLLLSGLLLLPAWGWYRLIQYLQMHHH